MSPRNKIREEEVEKEQWESSKTETPSYYYDDSHGYENYDPEKEEDEECDD